MSLQLDHQVGISSPGLRVYSGSQEEAIEVVEVSRSMSVYRWGLKWVFTQTAGYHQVWLQIQIRMCPIATKFPPNPWIPGTSSSEMLWSAWHLPGDGVTGNVCSLSLCPSPPVLQEPLWVCMLSAGCRTTSAGSCTATFPMTGGLGRCSRGTQACREGPLGWAWDFLCSPQGFPVAGSFGTLTSTLAGPAQSVPSNPLSWGCGTGIF